MLVYYISVTEVIAPGEQMNSKRSSKFSVSTATKTILSFMLVISMSPFAVVGARAFADDSVWENVEGAVDTSALPVEDKTLDDVAVANEVVAASDEEESAMKSSDSSEVDAFQEEQRESTEAEVQVENSFRFKDGVPINAIETTDVMKSRGFDSRAGSNGYMSFGYGPCPGGDAGRGIDVSHWQGKVDWAKVKFDGVNFAILKCASGISMDPQFKNNVEGCKNVGMKFGVYYYSYATDPAQGTTDAARVVSQLDAAGVSASELSFPIYYDLEDVSVKGMSSADKAALAWNFEVALRNAGYSKIGIYSNMDWWCNQLTDPYFKNSNLYRWVAQYNYTGLGYSSAGLYDNHPFSDFRARGDVWQFSSSGRVAGISGDVDLNYSYHNMISSSDPGAMFRLYNPNSGEHFYTASAYEGNHLINVGWSYEGVSWVAPSSSDTPVYRVYNPNAGDHHYTMSAYERDSLVRVGWQYEGIGWYSDDAQTMPLHRLYNPNARAGSHHYTTSAYERDSLVRAGWSSEGLAWYGLR